jgi:hypothetical protein
MGAIVKGEIIMQNWEPLLTAIKEKMLIGISIDEETLSYGKLARNLFTEYNSRFYNGELPETDIYINPIEDGNFGLFEPDGLGVWYGITGRPAIVLYPNAIESEEQLKEVLLHEMAHEYCDIKGIEDISSRTVQHTAAFAEVCRSHGLCYDENETDWMNTKLA